mmetsp:Transcript_109573/g.353662  ORF Transcript_109573/g.353662 Transcript_109573/m.353662 type:complete len:288 (+) Transcript_109573:1441-2304(+)
MLAAQRTSRGSAVGVEGTSGRPVATTGRCGAAAVPCQPCTCNRLAQRLIGTVEPVEVKVLPAERCFHSATVSRESLVISQEWTHTASKVLQTLTARQGKLAGERVPFWRLRTTALIGRCACTRSRWGFSQVCCAQLNEVVCMHCQADAALCSHLRNALKEPLLKLWICSQGLYQARRVTVKQCSDALLPGKLARLFENRGSQPNKHQHTPLLHDYIPASTGQQRIEQCLQHCRGHLKKTALGSVGFIWHRVFNDRADGFCHLLHVWMSQCTHEDAKNSVPQDTRRKD